MDETEAAAREKFERAVQAALTEYLGGQYPDQPGLYVVGWIVSAEYTSVEREQANQGGLHSVAPMAQLLSTSRGLAGYATDRWTAT